MTTQARIIVQAFHGFPLSKGIATLCALFSGIAHQLIMPCLVAIILSPLTRPLVVLLTVLCAGCITSLFYLLWIESRINYSTSVVNKPAPFLTPYSCLLYYLRIDLPIEGLLYKAFFSIGMIVGFAKNRTAIAAICLLILSMLTEVSKGLPCVATWAYLALKRQGHLDRLCYTFHIKSPSTRFGHAEGVSRTARLCYA